MPRDWETGNAARQLPYDDNPYKPIDYAARLQEAGKRPSSQSGGQSYAPGQLYGGSWMNAPKHPDAYQPAEAYQPPVYDPPMMYDQPPVYDQPAQPCGYADWQPMQAPQGMPYNAAMFDHQPTAVMPSGLEETPFAYRSPDDWSALMNAADPYAQPWQDDVLPQEEPEWNPPAEEAQPEDIQQASEPWRDPFTPAAPKENEKPKKNKKAKAAPQQKPPVRIARVIALIAAVAMLVFCGVVGTRLVMDLVRNERSMENAREAYLQENGVELHNGAARVELLPDGQTFAPTATPSPTPYFVTPSPTPVIPINEAAMLSLSGRDNSQVQAVEAPTPSPCLRTRLTTYPKNPLRNIQPSLAELVKENSDVIGRLVIPGLLDEIVMQRNNTYYLTRSSLGVTSEAGAVFADESCSLRMPPENLLLRGQSSVPGKVFEPLWKFASGGVAFVSGATTAQLTTLYEDETYQLFAVIVADSDPNSPGYFNYASNPTFTTDEAMMRYVQTARQLSLYQFDVDVRPSDRLLTLATLGSGESCLVLLYRLQG